ncbi:hypothetical protein THTE_1544 [Thermogutta terrifontis]|uniref:CRISPR type III-B/RAMP module-associated protein Cmr5 n=1 Tax=Thermogutta terrifontis TaxID=1331910 RepID=A0A286RDV8_9BACT|nr:hypothetical protein [Thermogutta terrifontis]ASV74146.1 hypothetical protein THTE_1544 [Thermogutta terrifontis]
MSSTQMTNLDIRCAELGRELANIPNMEEKILNAALTVLEGQGPYAMFLYLKAKHSAVADPISGKSLSFLKDVFHNRLDGANDILDAIKRLAENLADLLFARDLLRMALSYARYHLKARGDGSS